MGNRNDPLLIYIYIYMEWKRLVIDTWRRKYQHLSWEIVILRKWDSNNSQINKPYVSFSRIQFDESKLIVVNNYKVHSPTLHLFGYYHNSYNSILFSWSTICHYFEGIHVKIYIRLTIFRIPVKYYCLRE